MTKAVVYAIIATASLFFIVLNLWNLGGAKARLNRKLGYQLRERVPDFDPILTKIELQAERNGRVNHNNNTNNVNISSPRHGLDSTSSTRELAETYYNLTSGADKLNTTLRLTILFPLLDREPKDGFVSFNELHAWITQRAQERLDYVTQSEMDSKDLDGDMAVSFKEYLPQFSEQDIEKRDMEHGEAGWWMNIFEIADLDHNGVLNFTELRDLVNPEDSKNPDILKWMIRDRLKNIDDEINGRLKFNEFETHVYSTYESYMDFETNGGDVPSANDKFAELDANKDQLLSPDELIPILPHLFPGELDHAKYFTSYLINEADDNEDGKLSLQEMLNHEYIFYNTVHADNHEENDKEHDEL